MWHCDDNIINLILSTLVNKEGETGYQGVAALESKTLTCIPLVLDKVGESFVFKKVFIYFHLVMFLLIVLFVLDVLT